MSKFDAFMFSVVSFVIGMTIGSNWFPVIPEPPAPVEAVTAASCPESFGISVVTCAVPPDLGGFIHEDIPQTAPAVAEGSISVDTENATYHFPNWDSFLDALEAAGFVRERKDGDR